MPSITRKVCVKHGIYNTKVCPKCADLQHQKNKESNKIYDKTKRNQERKTFYNSNGWKSLRFEVLVREPFCRVCKIEPAKAVDHICPIAQGGEQTNIENLQPICNSCHSKKTAIEKQIFYPDWLQLPLVKVTLVSGSIGSGKSTYVKANAQENDLIIDLDDIKARITNKSMYQWESNEKITECIHARNVMLHELSMSRSLKYNQVWFIASAARGTDREFWSRKLNADVILLKVSKSICIKRVEQDERRKHDIQSHINLVEKWFKNFTESSLDNVTE